MNKLSPNQVKLDTEAKSNSNKDLAPEVKDSVVLNLPEEHEVSNKLLQLRNHFREKFSTNQNHR